mmetsp:Transcript_28021/g.82028  ORF Transcript_28021/g.82028 Transcript_28021/m.82028 type:complete len:336 (+) Transcript_28021:742-1749(+)
MSDRGVPRDPWPSGEKWQPQIRVVWLPLVEPQSKLTEVVAIVSGVNDVGVLKRSIVRESGDHRLDDVVHGLQCGQSPPVQKVYEGDHSVVHGTPVHVHVRHHPMPVVVGHDLVEIGSARRDEPLPVVGVLRGRIRWLMCCRHREHSKDWLATRKVDVQKIQGPILDEVHEVVLGVVVPMLLWHSIVRKRVVVVYTVPSQRLPVAPPGRHILQALCACEVHVTGFLCHGSVEALWKRVHSIRGPIAVVVHVLARERRGVTQLLEMKSNVRLFWPLLPPQRRATSTASGVVVDPDVVDVAPCVDGAAGGTADWSGSECVLHVHALLHHEPPQLGHML